MEASKNKNLGLFSIDNLKVVVTFIAGGLLCGTLFSLVQAFPVISNSLFEKHGTNVTPRLDYWMLHGILSVACAGLSYFISRRHQKPLMIWHRDFYRTFLACIIVALSASISYIIAPRISELFEVARFVAFLSHFGFIALASCIFTRKTTLFPFAFLLILPFGIASVPIFIGVCETIWYFTGRDWDKVGTVICITVQAMQFAFIGCWMVWRNREQKYIN